LSSFLSNASSSTPVLASLEPKDSGEAPSLQPADPSNAQTSHTSLSAPVKSTSHHSAAINVVAVTGCDGSGKSTLAHSLVDALGKSQQVEFMYLGQSSGKIGDWIGELPIIGKAFKRFLVGKSKNVHDKPASVPDVATATVIFLLSCWRAIKFFNMLEKSKKGTLIVTDRYPQDQVPGFRFDGAQLAKTEGGNAYVRQLRTWEKGMYTRMANHLPLLVIRLDIDVDTAFSRKPDHSKEALAQKIAVYPQLHFSGADILDLDGRDSADQVLSDSLKAIEARQTAR